MSKVFLVAVGEELNHAEAVNGIPVLVCGVGKLNAAMGVFECIQKGFTEIINIGSCGSLNHQYGEILKIGKVYQDIDVRPICGYGLSPFEPAEPFIEIDGVSTFSCFSTDYFYDQNQGEKYSKEYLQGIKSNSVFDMECYAMAKACRKFGVKFSAYKWVSDDGDHSHWVENCRISFEKFKSQYF
jgi:adenosylhomocysteine nucleosidase